MPSVAPVTRAHEPYFLRFFGGLRNVMKTHLRIEIECLRKERKPMNERKRSKAGWVVR